MPQSAPDKLQLRDIHLPASPDIWPPAPGWWILATLLLFLCGWALFKYLRHQRCQREQQAVLANLIPIEKKLLNKPDNQVLAELNVLLRQLALMHYPHTQIASLNGKQWLQFLDHAGQTNQFTQGVGHILADAPYRTNDATLLTKKQVKALIKLVKEWVSKTVHCQTGRR